MIRQGLNSNGEELSSAYVEKDNADTRFSIDFSDTVSLTRQEFADDCDINKLMAKYEKLGEIPINNNFGRGQFLDIADVPDLMTSLQILDDATTAFKALPAIVRKEFENDPVKFIEFASDPANIEKMREYGLAAPAPEPEKVQKVEIINNFPDKKSDKSDAT